MTNPTSVGRILRYAIVMGVCAGPALADTTCIFDTECLEGEACADSGFTLSIESGGIVTDAETIPVADTLTAGGATAVSGASGGGFHLISIAEGGAARYSAHLPAAEMSILYIGTCTEAG
ncbi:MAG: hypothetical protein AAGA87_06495 [Pseudomonadota bacterium]